MKTIHPLIIAVSVFGLSLFKPQAGEIYVSPAGSSTGDGSQTRPLDLATALSSASPVKPGDTVWLRGGRYIGKFSSSLAGTGELPIVVRSYPTEWAILDRGEAPSNRANILSVNGAWTTYRDFEVTSSDPSRLSAYTGSYPSDIKRGEGISVRAPNTRLINLVIHDTAQGISAWAEGPDTEVYGCLIYHNGWQGPDRAHGHGIYSQNETGQKLFRDNIILNQFEKGIQIYGSSAGSLKNFTLEGNSLFNNGILSSGGAISENITIYGGTGPEGIIVRQNLCYGAGFNGKLIIGGEGAKDLVFENNYVPHSTRIRFWQTARVTGNTFLRDTTVLEYYTDQATKTLPYVWDYNLYLAQELKYTPFGLYIKNADGTTTGKGLNFSGWRTETGFDEASQYYKTAPTGTYAVVRPNAYEPGRGMVTVYNWDRLSSVALPLGTLLAAGEGFEIRSAQNYLAGPVISGTYDGADILVPTSGWGVATPVGVAAPPEAGPEFNVFMVRGTGVLKKANTAPVISAIADQSILENEIAGPAPFTVSDAESVSDQLGVFASSSNPTLVPSANITTSGAGGDRSVAVKPASGQSGKATITLTVSDGALLASTSFALTVLAVNQPPVITAVADQITDEDVPTAPIAFSINDRETPANNLMVWVSSSDTALTPVDGIFLSSADADRTLTIAPAAQAHGTATITIFVSDGELAASSAFKLTVNSVNDTPTITGILDQSTIAGMPTAPLPFVISDVETASETLFVKAHSTDTTALPNENISLAGTSAERTITVTPSATASGNVKIYVVVTDGSKSEEIGFWLDIQPANQPPSISAVGDQVIDEDTSTKTLLFLLSDKETAAASLRVWGSSSNTTLIPDGNIVLGETDGQRSVTVTPAANQYGTGLVTLTVSDGSLTAATSFSVTVNPINDYPTLSPINPQVTYAGASLVLPFTIGDAETPASELRVTARSTNTRIVPSAGLVLVGSGADRTLTVTPAPNQFGKLKIYLTVTDGSKSIEKSFAFTSAK